MLHNDAELRYLRCQTDVNDVISGMPTYLIIVESLVRSWQVLWHREQLRKVLVNFFSSIYVDRYDRYEEAEVFLNFTWLQSPATFSYQL